MSFFESFCDENLAIFAGNSQKDSLIKYSKIAAQKYFEPFFFIKKLLTSCMQSSNNLSIIS